MNRFRKRTQKMIMNMARDAAQRDAMNRVRKLELLLNHIHDVALPPGLCKHQMEIYMQIYVGVFEQTIKHHTICN